MNWAPLAIAIALLAVNAFFVAAEFALIAARRTYLEREANEGDQRAVWALRSSHELSLMLAGAQLGVTLASVGLGFVAEPAVAHLFESLFSSLGVPESALHIAAFAVGLTLVVFVHMVIGEMVPKNLAIADPERAALAIAAPLRAYRAVLGPIIHVLNQSANRVLRMLGVEPADELTGSATADELATMLGDASDEGFIDEFEHQLLSGALHFDHDPVTTVMVPREGIIAAPITATIDELEQLVVESGRSRVPVYRDDIDHIVGYLHARALLDIPAGARQRPPHPVLLRPIPRLPADQPLNTALAAMRHQRTHIAVVTDSTQTTIGLVTLQDILQRLVGQIYDGDDPPT